MRFIALIGLVATLSLLAISCRKMKTYGQKAADAVVAAGEAVYDAVTPEREVSPEADGDVPVVAEDPQEEQSPPKRPMPRYWHAVGAAAFVLLAYRYARKHKATRR